MNKLSKILLFVFAPLFVLSFVFGGVVASGSKEETSQPKTSIAQKLTEIEDENYYVVSNGEVYSNSSTLTSTENKLRFNNNKLVMVFTKGEGTISTTSLKENTEQVVAVISATKAEDGITISTVDAVNDGTIKHSLDAEYTLGKMVTNTEERIKYSNGEFEILSSTQAISLTATAATDTTTAWVANIGVGKMKFSNQTYGKADSTTTGRAFYVTGGTLTLENTKIQKFSVTGSGAAIYSTSGIVNIKTGTIISENISTSNGGGIYSTATVDISGGEISNNTTSANGGGIYVSGTLIVSGGTIKENSAVDGGGIWSSATTTITGGNFSKNSSTDDGGALCLEGGSASITGGTFSENSANDDGGALFLNANSTITGGVFTKNSGYWGGAINFYSGTYSVTGATFTENIANKTSGNGGGKGGAICSYSSLTIGSNTTISGNSSALYGGAIYTNNALTITGGTITNNSTSGAGNAIFYDGSNASVSLSNCSISHGTGTGGHLIVSAGGGETITITSGTYTAASGTFAFDLNGTTTCNLNGNPTITTTNQANFWARYNYITVGTTLTKNYSLYKADVTSFDDGDAATSYIAYSTNSTYRTSAYNHISVTTLPNTMQLNNGSLKSNYVVAEYKTYSITDSCGYWDLVDSSSAHATNLTVTVSAADGSAVTLSSNGTTTTNGSITVTNGNTFTISHKYKDTKITIGFSRTNTNRDYRLWHYDSRTCISEGANSISGEWWTPTYSENWTYYVREYIYNAAVAKTGISSATVSNAADIKGQDGNHETSCTWTATVATGYTFRGWYTSSDGSGTAVSTSTSYTKNNIKTDNTLYAYATINTYSVKIDPNGGTLNGSSSSKTVSMNYSSQTALDIPTRTGYTFTGWSLSGSGSLGSNNAFGSPLGSYATFYDGNRDVNVYNNTGNGNVTFSYQNADGYTPTNSNKFLRITTSGYATPGHGGYYHGNWTGANNVFYTVIVARIPVGYTIEWQSNATGGGYATWITSTAGTGDWFTYIVRVNCGSNGNYSSTNFFNLAGGSAPVVWDVAFTRVYDATGLSSTVLNTPQMFTTGLGNATLTATWSINTYTLTASNGYWVANPNNQIKVTASGCTISAGGRTGNGSLIINKGETFTVSHTYSTSAITITEERVDTSRTHRIWAYDGSHEGTNSHSGTWTPSSDASWTYYVRECFNVTAYTDSESNGASTSGGASGGYSITGDPYWGTIAGAGTTGTTWGYYGNTVTYSGSANTGYTWQGWYTGPTGGGTRLTTSTTYTVNSLTSDVTYYGYATANTYNIYFTAGNEEFDIAGSDSGWSEYTFNTFYYDKVYRISDYITSAPGKTGYSFAGWRVTNNLNTSTAKYGSSSSTSSSVGSSTNIPNSYYIKNLTPTNGATVTLTAQWSVNYYSVTVKYYSFSGANATNLNVSGTTWDGGNTAISSGGSVRYGYSPDGNPTFAYGSSVTITVSRVNTSYNYFIARSTPTGTSSINEYSFSYTVSTSNVINIYVLQSMTVYMRVNNTSAGHYTNYSGGADRGTSFTISGVPYNKAISISGKNIWSFGTSPNVDVNATNYSGYKFNNFTVNGSVISNGYKITSNVFIYANFESTSTGKTVYIKACGSGWDYQHYTVFTYNNGIKTKVLDNGTLTTSGVSITVKDGETLCIRRQECSYSDGSDGGYGEGLKVGSSSGGSQYGNDCTGSEGGVADVDISYNNLSNGATLWVTSYDEEW